MSVIWAKVWYDLWRNKTRTLLAVLSIAAGVFAIGAMFGMADLLLSTLNASNQAVVPPHLDIALSTRVDQDTILNLRRIKGVEGVQPYNQITVRYKLRPQDEWKQGVVHMLDDFNQQKYELVELREGRWPEKDDVGIERMAAQYLNLGIGDTIIFKLGNSERVLPISGKIRHPFVPPPQFMDLAFFFMDAQGLERLGVPAGEFGGIYVRVTPYSADYAREVAAVIKDRLAKQNIGVAGTVYQDPHKHWGSSIFEGITLVLKVLAVISLLTSAVLVFNTLSNLITQQTDQIGIIKAIGGRTGTIVQVYLTGVLVYGLLALLIALPLGALLAFGMSRWLLNFFNIDYDVFQVSTQAIILQALAAIAVPVLAGLLPVLQGAAITVRQAIASYGLGGNFGYSWLDRIVEQVGLRLLPSHYATALGNMFRRKGRLILTQAVLVTAGATFLMVMSLSSSISLTLDQIFERQRYDITIQFTQNQRIAQVVDLAQSIPGVEKAEVWFSQPATILTEGERVKEAGIGSDVYGVPAGSDFFKPLIVAGRWLEARDGRVVVLTKSTADKYHIQLGGIITLDLGELGKDDWQVIGLYEPVFAGAFSTETIYAPRQALFEATNKYNRGRMLYVRTYAHEAASTDAVTAQLKDLYERRNVKVVISQTEHEIRQTNEFQFSIVTAMLLSLAIIVAVVGGIALMGALSISVVERTKEIGVLRAVGARSGTIMGMFVMEGVLQGLLSWAMALPLSFILSRPMATALGQAMFSATLDYQYHYAAVLIWLVTIVIISSLASILPAYNATRISVRDSLAYA
jgi:putative ABC transport system permease protein